MHEEATFAVKSGLDWKLQLSTGSITRIGWGAEGPVVHSFNWTAPG